MITNADRLFCCLRYKKEELLNGTYISYTKNNIDIFDNPTLKATRRIVFFTDRHTLIIDSFDENGKNYGNTFTEGEVEAIFLKLKELKEGGKW